MEHAPIYRSTSRRANRSLFPWRRTASLATAAAALTVSGISLGYHGFSDTPISTPSVDSTTEATPPDAGNIAAPVPTISFAVADGGHPDVISAISSALIARFQISQAPILALPIGLPVQPLPAPPQSTPEPFVLPASVTEPLPGPTEQPLDEAAPVPEDVAPAPIVEALAPVNLDRAPFAAAAVPQNELAMDTPEDVPTNADDVQSEAPPEPAAIAAQPAPTRVPPTAVPPAPRLEATPVPATPVRVPIPAKLERIPLPDKAIEPRVEVRRVEPAPAPAAKPENKSGKDTQDNSGPRPEPAKTEKGKGSGPSHGG